MKKNDFYTYLTVSLAMLIPFPGRLAYGILMVCLLNILMLIGTVVSRLSAALEVEELHPVIVSIALLSLSILFRQLLVMFSPLLALTLGFLIYIPAFSSFMIGSLYSTSNEKLGVELKNNMKQSGLISLTAVLFFLFRDIFGYGTITLPSPEGLFTIKLFNADKNLLMGNIWASIPGALILAAVVLILSIHIKKKFEIVRTLNAGYSTAVESQPTAGASSNTNTNTAQNSTVNAQPALNAAAQPVQNVQNVQGAQNASGAQNINNSSNGGNVNA